MRILAVDPGTKRIGLALCDELEISVRPLPVLMARGVERDARAIADLVARHAVEGIVIGLPLHMDGTPSPASRRAEKLARRLHLLTGRPISLWDERLTSVEAERLLRERGEPPKPERIDQVAACVILSDFLAHRRSLADPVRAWNFSARPSEPQRGRSLLSSLALLLLIFGLGASLLTLMLPRHHQAAARLISIPPGTSARQVLNALHKQGIIAHPLPVLAYLTLTGQSAHLKAGDYRFPSPISPLEVVRKLIRGEVVLEKVTIPEGLNRFEIADVISTLPLRDADRAREFTEDVNLIRDLDPQADSLEGYLFPDTYTYTSSTSARELIARMVARFREVFTDADRAHARQLGFTIREIVTLASLIEKEAKRPEERPLISSVFHNRLKRGMKLECDPTVLYAALLEGEDDRTIHRSDLLRPSPYNTYFRAGLPPGPIASPGRDSLKAALYPAQTDYLYFVVDGTRQDGTHRFARTLAEHTRNVALYRSSLSQKKALFDSSK